MKNEENYSNLDKKYVWHPWTSNHQLQSENLIIEEGEGCYVKDTLGNIYLDAKSSVLNASCGYSHPIIINAVYEQLGKLMNFDHADGFSTIPSIKLAKKLAELLPQNLERTFFCNSGSEAVETAFKMARMYFRLIGKKDKLKVISFDKGYHGITLGAMGASNIESAKTDNFPLPIEYDSIPTPICNKCSSMEVHKGCSYPDSSILEEKILSIGPDSVAAFIMEPILGLGGIIIPPVEYVKGIRRICSKYNVMLILDETMTCMGRTGKMFAFEHFDIIPDILICGKGISGGYFPLSTITTSQEIYNTFSRDKYLNGFRHGHTNSGHSTASSAALATINVIEQENLVRNSSEIGTYLLTKLSTLQDKYDFVYNLRGLGLIIAMDVNKGAEVDNKIYKLCMEEGLIIRQMGSTIVLLPPLILKKEEADEIILKLNQAFYKFSEQEVLV
ncbi:aspartate aminotransferase family protein [Priestia filamentosa]|uniref:aminotransferase family protein n=1 Tax=Priestia filamentosa TaxID=1402861 RepID=UPI001FB2BFDD|nr:aspartate aminotransferase family protein [Priestia filamentosa]UOE58274.1 aspartate aminotransferase family protein [Priestia filamentosa]